MSDNLSLSITGEDLSHLIEMFHGYEQNFQKSFLDKRFERHRPQISIEDELKEACEYIQDREDQDKYLLKRMIDVLSGLKMALGVDKEKANAFEGEARELAEQLERHGAQTEYLKECMESQENSNEELRRKLMEAEDRLEEIQVKEEKKNIEVTQQQSQHAEAVQTHLEFEKQIRALKDENEALLGSLEASKKRTEQLCYDFENSHNKNAELMEKISRLEMRIYTSEQKKALLEKENWEKQSMISRLENKLDRKDSKPRNRTSLLRDSFIGSMMDRESLVGEPINLNEELHDNKITIEDDAVFSYMDLRHSDSMVEMDSVLHSHRQSVMDDIEIQPFREIKAFQDIQPFREEPSNTYFDPYFVHFVLSCQSLKIQMGQQGRHECLAVDMSHRYKDILASRVPMHEWNEWIRHKLGEMAARR